MASVLVGMESSTCIERESELEMTSGVKEKREEKQEGTRVVGGHLSSTVLGSGEVKERERQRKKEDEACLLTDTLSNSLWPGL